MNTPIKKFAHYLQQAERSPFTIKNYVADLGAFSDWFNVTNDDTLTPDKITPTDLREYKQFLSRKKQLKPSSINRKLATLKSFLNWAEQTKQIPYSLPMPRRLARTKQGPRWLDRREQNQLLRTAESQRNRRNLAIIKIILNTGLRVQELCALRWEDIVIDARKGTLVVKHGKGNKQREVPLNKEARDAFLSLGYTAHIKSHQFIFTGQRGALTTRGVQFMLRRYADLAKIKGISPHHLRHTFCKNLVNAGIGLEKIAAMAGHENLETTRRYCEPSLADLQQAVELIGEAD